MSTVGRGAVMVVTAPCKPASRQCYRAIAVDPSGMHQEMQRHAQDQCVGLTVQLICLSIHAEAQLQHQDG